MCELVYSLLEDDGVFLHWDLLDENDREGLSIKTVKNTLTKAGFSSVYVAKVFDIESEKGPQPVIIGVGRKLLS